MHLATERICRGVGGRGRVRDLAAAFQNTRRIARARQLAHGVAGRASREQQQQQQQQRGTRGKIQM